MEIASRQSKIVEIRKHPPSSSRVEWHGGELKDKEMQVEGMYYKKTRDKVVATYPEEDINPMRECKKKDVQEKEKSRNIIPFVPLSPRLN